MERRISCFGRGCSAGICYLLQLLEYTVVFFSHLSITTRVTQVELGHYSSMLMRIWQGSFHHTTDHLSSPLTDQGG